MAELMINLTTSEPYSYSNYNDPHDNNDLPPLSSLEWIVITFSIIVIIISVVCNMTVIATIVYNRQLRTTTNYFMISQSIADMLFAIIVILGMILQALLGYWPFAPFWCAIYNACGIGLVMVSILNFCAISIERYVAICHPFYQHRINVNVVFLLIIIYIWVQPIILSLIPMMIWHDYTTLDYNQCGHIITITAEKVYFLILMTINIFLPGLVLSILYAIIFKTACGHIQQIKRQNSIHCPQKPSGKRSDNTRNSITYQDVKLLLIFVFIIGTFYITWMPFFVTLFMTYFDEEIFNRSDTEGLRLFFTISTMMSFSHCAINPVAYNFMNTEMRRGLWNLLGISQRRRRQSLRLSLQPTYTKSSRASRYSKRGSTQRSSSNGQIANLKWANAKQLQDSIFQEKLDSLSSPLHSTPPNGQSSVAVTTV